MSSSKANEKSQPPAKSGELFLVATPIGHLKDITLRALEVLQSVDRIACEDTRVSGGLLKHYGITTPMTAYHAHNEAEASAQLVAQLAAGTRVALISDAGTPLLSDPGARLVRAAIAAGVRVTPIPGASALLSAISIAGLSAETFYYAGFLPNKTTARKAALAPLSMIPATLVFYESPHRLLDTLGDLLTVLGNRDAAVARELTKLHEECVRGSLAEIIAHFEKTAPRGECVIIVHGAAPPSGMDDGQIDAALRAAMQTLSLKQAVAQVAAHAGRAKSDVYARALLVKGGHMKTTNHVRGLFAESMALAWLTLKGYRLVIARYKTSVGEVDLIMRRGRKLIFVEVKARADRGDAAAAIHKKNQARVVRAAQHFLTCHPDYLDYEVRFDAVLIAWYSLPQHLANAFGEGF